MEQILTDNNNEIHGVFAANDNLAQQAINALEAAGVGNIPISGQDASAAGMQNIVLGKQTMSVYKPFNDQGKVAADVAVALCNGEDFEEAATSFESDLASGGSVRLDHRHRHRVRRGHRLTRRRRIHPVRRARPHRRDGRQHGGHRGRRRVPHDRGDLHRRHGEHGLLSGEQLSTRPGMAGARRAPPPRRSGGRTAPVTGPSSSAGASRGRSAPSRPCTASTSRCGAARSWRSSATTGPASRRSSRASSASIRSTRAPRSSRGRTSTSTGRATRPTSASRSSTRISPSPTTSTSSRTCSSAGSASATSCVLNESSMEQASRAALDDLSVTTLEVGPPAGRRAVRRAAAGGGGGEVGHVGLEARHPRRADGRARRGPDTPGARSRPPSGREGPGRRHRLAQPPRHLRGRPTASPCCGSASAWRSSSGRRRPSRRSSTPSPRARSRTCRAWPAPARRPRQ